jgi:hypothetical protein
MNFSISWVLAGFLTFWLYEQATAWCQVPDKIAKVSSLKYVHLASGLRLIKSQAFDFCYTE